MTEPNTNCLAGIQCPNCKSTGPFDINASACFTFHDDGTENFRNVEFGQGNFCACHQCDYDGCVLDFQTGEQS